MTIMTDLRFAWRSLIRARGLTITVVLTLALGIGANAAIFTIVRGVLLAPLANEDEDRLIYIRHSAPGLALDNTYFSMPEIRDLGVAIAGPMVSVLAQYAARFSVPRSISPST